MTVGCSVTNATKPNTPNGSVSVSITGGTSPYTITWDNGQIGNTITNLLPGTYGVTVVDFYGDYTASTQCTVGSDMVFAQRFDGCNTYSGVTIYTTGLSINPTKPFIKFNQIDGCYEYIGVFTITSGYSALTVSNSYPNCNLCDPPTPTPVVQQTLCLSNGVDTQYEFSPNGTDSNGNFQWINTQYSMTITYNATARNSYWQVGNWVGTGALRKYQMPAATFPTGSWVNEGNPIPENWVVTIGECQGFQLTVNASVSNPECLGNNGSVTLIGAGGTPPYQYNIQGYTSSLQTSGNYTNVPPNTYTASVQDSNSNVATVNFTIENGQTSTNYILVLTRGTISTNVDTFANSITKSYDYSFYTSPSLPNGVTLTFDLKLTHSREKGGELPSTSSVQFNDTFTVLKNGSSQTTNDSSVTNSFANPCGSRVAYVSSFNTTSNNITMTNIDTISGTLSQTVDLNIMGDDCSCPTYGDYDTTLQAINVRITGASCATVTNTTNTLPMEVYKSGCNALT